MDLNKLLRDVPAGTVFHCSPIGKVRLEQVDPLVVSHGNTMIYLSPKGSMSLEEDSECVLFPSKDKRDWVDWSFENADPPVDTPMMVRNSPWEEWRLAFYAGRGLCWVSGCRSGGTAETVRWRFTVPFSRFTPENIEKSLEYTL